jgi:pyruvate/2-oxoglutarate dehydrogenase complex dihydrolipoamide dehydrogenase (E3) component
MSGGYDVIVIGGGPPASTAPRRSQRTGLRVAVVERELVGGECSYWAGIPSQTLLRPGEAARGATERPRQVDVEAALAWRDYLVSNYSDAGQERWLAENRVDLLRGGDGPHRRAARHHSAVSHAFRDLFRHAESPP